MELVGRTRIPVLAITEPTYDAAAEVHDTVVKIRATEDEKIEMAMALVREYVDLERLWQAL
jgi:BioD-like phosphotransacetylase family protein